LLTRHGGWSFVFEQSFNVTAFGAFVTAVVAAVGR
jgi:hypothetical protein